MKKRTKLMLSVLAGAVLSMQASAQSSCSYGGPKDTAYAAKIWKAMQKASLVEKNTIQTKAYTGTHPHGAILQTIYTNLSVDGHNGEFIVKRNYRGKGVSIQSVSDHPDKYLGTITVMYKRPGFDSKNGDWFWVNFYPDGSLEKSKGKQVTGKPQAACIDCHSVAPGGNLVFTR